MENFSLGSERNPLEMKVAITWGRFQPGLNYSPGENPSPVSVVFSHLSKFSHANLHFAPGLKFIM